MVANTTPLTMQIDKRLGVTGNGMWNPDDDGRTNKARGCAPTCPGGIIAHTKDGLASGWGIDMEGLSGTDGLARG
ncbi:hypothetical protein GUJ93_ZPchr0006g45066 [Zizania palustris]|uniref:Uncharacterized protein n=1 Tax=Zizania palustris TaxID=103762 RepID=A0A8J5VLU5_ZIZPA|nr:hypothetical protein GUJ93_ZPchr0006g45066 [Zizania palustris]